MMGAKYVKRGQRILVTVGEVLSEDKKQENRE